MKFSMWPNLDSHGIMSVLILLLAMFGVKTLKRQLSTVQIKAT